jgi:hypothetical protein
VNDTTTLWRLRQAADETLCVMISCCAGAELQLRRNDVIVLRELYPDKATLYERSRELRAELSRAS